MKSGKTIDISKSSLVSLKAELIRKKEEAEKLKGSENYVKLPPKPKPEVKSNPGVSHRNERDVAEELSSEEVDLLKKSKDVLAIKAALYDQLQSGSMVSEDGKSRFLVDFEKKDRPEHPVTEEVGPLHPSQTEETGQHSSGDDKEDDFQDDDDSEWVEYKDCLGRSRKCLRVDLPAMKRRDEFLSKSILKEAPQKEEPATSIPKTEEEELKELVSNDMHLEEMRKKWEQKEMELLSKQNVYYEDLLFDEARSHGVGYWKFSTDEGKRLEEQDMLRKIRAETEQKQKEAKALRDRREQQRQARLIAARQRQRARLGLPPIDPKEILEASKDEPQPEPQEQEEVKEDLEVRLRKAAHVRPWDVGKDGVQQPVMTQEEWVEKKREERIDEFAPSYLEHGASTSGEGPLKKKKKKMKKDKKKLEQSEGIQVETNPEDLIGPFPPDENPLISRTKNYLKRRQAQETYQPEVYQEDTVPVPGPSRGAAIPPPMDFDYYTPGFKQRPVATPDSLKATADAIDAGLRLLREQVESAQQSNPKTT